MLFLNAHNITINNICIIGYGGFIDTSITETYSMLDWCQLVILEKHLRRYVLMVFNSSNITINKLLT